VVAHGKGRARRRRPGADWVAKRRRRCTDRGWRRKAKGRTGVGVVGIGMMRRKRGMKMIANTHTAPTTHLHSAQARS